VATWADGRHERTHAVSAVRTAPVASAYLADEHRVALRESASALLSSRALIWAVGVFTILVLGPDQLAANSFNHHHLVTPFGSTVANVLVGPAARWDSVWFLGIAHFGYHQPDQTVFFPLYPALMAAGGALLGGGTGANLIVGVLLSCGCAFGALYLLYRLTALELGAGVARNAVWIYAWLPAAFFLSAVYTESLFLLLTIGSFYAGRTGRWWLAGVLGGLAAATRNSGVLLVVPLLLLYLYGPRTHLPPDPRVGGLKPRYRPRRDVLWIAAVPAGLIAYLAYLKLAQGHALTPFQEESHWHRSFVPLGGIPGGTWLALKSLVALIPGVPPAASMGDVRKVVELAFLAIGVWLVWRSWKWLPLAYAAYAAVGLALAVSAPTPWEPLRSLPRFTLVIFPLWIALALWATERRRVYAVLLACVPLVAAWAVLFISWTWAA
jgi:Mannosyltransferase (PIG-V)